MAVELKILSGSRAGQVKRYEQAVIVVGRQAGMDLRFDPQNDLDVSGRHAEIRGTEGHYSLLDHDSTNGTFVNGKKIEGSIDLKDGDKIRFGANGPEVELKVVDAPGAPHPITANSVTPRSVTPTKNTEQRIAIAVSKQTAGLKIAVLAAVLLIVVGGGGAVWYSRSQSAKQVEELRQQLADNERMRVMLQSSMRESGDTALVNEIQRKQTELQKRLPAASTDAERDRIKAEIDENQRKLRRMVQMDLPAIHKRNAPAVAIMISEIGGKSFAGSGFAIGANGLLLTNRHNVRDSLGRTPSRIAVKFTETRDWLPAKVVKISDDDDLALIQIDRDGHYPVVTGVSSRGDDASEGMSVATIGYPLGYDTPMEGEGNDFLAKATLGAGTVSKKTSSVLQIDSYATHGSSGSPVFNSSGLVVGVVYGGQRDAGGKIVYAVPPERIAAFIPAQYKSIIRD